MPKDLSVRDNFGLLPEPEGRWGSFGVSMVTNLTIMALLVLLTAAVHKVQKQKYIEHMVFTEKNEPPPPPKIIVPKVKVIAPPQPEVVKLDPPKIVVPKIQPPPELPKPVKLDQPDQPKLPPAPPKAVAPPAATEGRPVRQRQADAGGQQHGAGIAEDGWFRRPDRGQDERQFHQLADGRRGCV